MNTNYDKELLLDFIEWLAVRGVWLYSLTEEGLANVGYTQTVTFIDQYLEDDE